MNFIRFYFVLVVFLWAGLGFSPVQALPTVSNVSITQRYGTKLVDVRFDATDGFPPYYTSLEASTDGGITWSVPVRALSGSVGTQIQPGTNLLVTWDAGADWNSKTSAAMMFRFKVYDSVDTAASFVSSVAVPDEFSVIPGGWYYQGRTSGDSDGGVDPSAPSTAVNISTFYISKFEINHELWNEVVAWGRIVPPPDKRYNDLPFSGGQGEFHPAYGMSWYDVVKWCNARSEMEELRPVYAQGINVYRNGKNMAPPWDDMADGYRLPTEAEWEKAARGGTTNKRFPSAVDTITHLQANYRSTTDYPFDVSATRGYHPDYGIPSVGKPYTSPMGSLVPNGYGLFDMAGNIAEYCWDWYSVDYYTSKGKPTLDPRGPTSLLGPKVLRGGSWDSNGGDCRSAVRGQWPIDGQLINRFGLRVAASAVVAPDFRSTDTLVTTPVETRSAKVTTIVQPSGRGTVTPTGLQYVYGTNATLTAVPLPGYRFVGWSGSVTSADNPLVLPVNGAGLTLYANFTVSDRAYLTVVQPPANEGAIAGGGDYEINSTATLTATPAEGFLFSHWTGDASGSVNPRTIVMSGNKSVGAVFMADDSDTDGDGLTAHDEIVIHGTNPLLADSDRDGWLDGSEVAFKGNPLSESEAPRFEAQMSLPPGPGNIVLKFPCAPGISHSIESSQDLVGWQNVETGIFAAGSVVERSIPKTSVPTRFFRVKRDLADTFASIPAGPFTMGGGFSDAPVVSVQLDAFRMAKREVGFAQWNQVRGWASSHGYTDLPLGLGKGPEHPVYWIDWHSMVKWCNACSEMFGLEPCYTVGGEVYRIGVSNAVGCNWNATGFRLPTEAEWEKAARGGVSGHLFPWGGDTISHTLANYLSKSDYAYDISPTRGTHPTYSVGGGPYTSPVASFTPNGYGLYDMAGNVWEWCWDWYASNAYTEGAVNPRGPVNGTYRVLRGGGWSSEAPNVGVSYRDPTGLPTNGEYDNSGFRVVLKSIP